MWTRSAKKENGFKVEGFDECGVLVFEEWFDTMEEADNAGHMFQRRMTFETAIPSDISGMTDDDILKELLGD